MKKLGPATEAVIASKRDKHGLRFGFARFEKGFCIEEMTKALGQIEVDGSRLFAKQARFNKDGEDTIRPAQKIQRNPVWRRLGGSNGVRKGNVSLVDALQGKQSGEVPGEATHPNPKVAVDSRVPPGNSYQSKETAENPLDGSEKNAAPIQTQVQPLESPVRIEEEDVVSKP